MRLGMLVGAPRVSIGNERDDVRARPRPLSESEGRDRWG